MREGVTKRALLLVGLLGGVAGACAADECDPGPGTCGSDGVTLSSCEDGHLVDRSCADEGQLCESGQCVEPWRFGSPQWSSCAGEPRSTAETLREKAARYDDVAARIHIHPDLKWMMGLELREGADEDTATYRDVARWHPGENDGLWSALFMASQAYRYAVTGSDEALQMLRILLEGEVDRMEVTGVPGMFTRMYIPPGVDGVSCPSDAASYFPSEDKHDNQWVAVHEDGCVYVSTSSQTLELEKTSHCGLERFAGYCWLDNVSKDEYSGHMFALGIVHRLVDDDSIRATVADLLQRFGEHLRENDLRIIDWDGRPTEHGKFHPLALDDFPGFNAAMALSFVRIIATVTKDPSFSQMYDECLLQRKGPMDCFSTGLMENLPFTDYLSSAGLYIGSQGCEANYNNISMHMLSLHNLIWYETEPSLKALYQQSLDVDVVRPADVSRSVIHQNNAFFDFIWAAQKKLGPDSDGPAYDAVENGICMLRQFRASQAQTQVDVSPELNEPYCKDRFGRDAAEQPKEIADRCSTGFVWWGDPYGIRATCPANPNVLEPPTGYLLPYWMGRYYGFIDEND